MNKKGQLYIMAALILAFILFGLMSVTNSAKEVSIESNFDKLAENYETESTKLVNSLLIDSAVTSTEISEKFTEFAAAFTSYAKSQNPNFGLIYAFEYDNELYVGNYLDTEIEFYCDGIGCPQPYSPDVLQGCFGKVEAGVSFDGLDMYVEQQLVDVQSLATLCTDTVTSPNIKKIGFFIGGFNFNFDIKPNHPEIIMVSLEKTDQELQVYVGGDLVA